MFASENGILLQLVDELADRLHLDARLALGRLVHRHNLEAWCEIDLQRGRLETGAAEGQIPPVPRAKPHLRNRDVIKVVAYCFSLFRPMKEFMIYFNVKSVIA